MSDDHALIKFSQGISPAQAKAIQSAFASRTETVPELEFTKRPGLK